MNATYEWLYDNYAEPLLEEIKTAEKQELEQLAQTLTLSDDGRVELYDYMTNMRLRWGAEVFALGLQMGVHLTTPHAEHL